MTQGSDPSGAEFGDLLEANAAFADAFEFGGFDGVAAKGVAIVTCMDSRIDPLRIVGLQAGDAKIFRNPGGRVTPQALEALVLCVHLLGVRRVMVIPHTRCAMALNTQADLQRRIGELTGQDATWQPFHTIDDQTAGLAHDVRKVTSHPLIPDSVAVGGFLYHVETGRLEPKV